MYLLNERWKETQLKMLKMRHRSNPYPSPVGWTSERYLPDCDMRFIQQFRRSQWWTLVNMVHWKIFSFLFIGYLLEAVVAASDSGSLADLAKILSQLAGGDNCVFRCPKGKLYVFHRSIDSWTISL